MGRGRPKKYSTEEELKTAQKAQRHEYNKKYNEIVKNKKSEEREMKKILYDMYVKGKLYDNDGIKITSEIMG